MPHAPLHRRTSTSARWRVLAATTALAVSGGVIAVGSLTVGDLGPDSEPASAALAEQPVDVAGLPDQRINDRAQRVSRSEGRTSYVERRVDELEQEARAARQARREARREAREQARQEAEAQALREAAAADPRALAQQLMPEYGLSAGEFSCLDQLWQKESEWETTAANPTSSAYGIPQALPGSKMSSAGPDWESNAETQIRWGLGYVRDRYGSACSAWSHSQANNWY